MANCKPEKWTTQQIQSLIDAYKEETCLYASDQANYHNKHLRAEALARVCEALKKVRPMTSLKECLNKFHNLRNQFNIEHSKVRASHKSGTGTDNIYKPSLWYYPKLDFLAKYVTPRKSRNSLEKMDETLASPQDGTGSVIDDNNENTQILEGSVYMNMVIFQENIESQVESMQDNSSTIPSNHLHELNTVLIPSPTTSNSDTREGSLVSITASASSPSTLSSSNSASSSSSNFDVQQNRPTFISPRPISSAPEISSASGIPNVSQRRSKKKRRLDSSDDDYASAIHELAESIKQPITINASENSRNTSVTTSFDPVSSFVDFVGSLLRSFHDEELKLQLMSDISQMVINAKTTDFQRTKRQ